MYSIWPAYDQHMTSIWPIWTAHFESIDKFENHIRNDPYSGQSDQWNLMAAGLKDMQKNHIEYQLYIGLPSIHRDLRLTVH